MKASQILCEFNQSAGWNAMESPTEFDESLPATAIPTWLVGNCESSELSRLWKIFPMMKTMRELPERIPIAGTDTSFVSTRET